MQSWKTPALLAAVGLCGLGSLFAQGPMLQPSLEPTPVSGPMLPMDSSPLPMGDAPVSDSIYSNPIAPSTTYDSHGLPMSAQPMSESHIIDNSPIYSEPSSSIGCNNCAAPAAVPVTECCASPAPTSSCNTAPASCCNTAPAPQYYVPQVVSQSACGCQSGSTISGGYGGSHAHHSGYGQVQGYTVGSGSGVSSGILSPNANSGGLHTRYPYYNYRHPWYYQGPPSQNVTIVW